MYRTSRISRRPIGRLLVVTLAMLGLTVSGCAGVSRRLSEVYEAAFVRSRERRELSEIRKDMRDELSEQRKEAMQEQAEWELEQARLDAEQERMEHDFCLAKQETLRQQVKRQVKDKLQSKLAFNVTHAIEVGELEVDVEKLKEMLKQREEQPFRGNGREEPFRGPDGKEYVRGGPGQKGCPCMEEECGCRPGLLKRNCPKCCYSLCEPGCGGPQAFQQAQIAPFRQPLRPAEIPLKLPVKLEFGMQNPEVEEAKIRKEPITEPLSEPFREEPFRGHPGQKPDQKPPSAQKTAADAATGANSESPRTAQRPTLPTPIPESDVAADPPDAERTAQRPVSPPSTSEADSGTEIPGLRAHN